MLHQFALDCKCAAGFYFKYPDASGLGGVGNAEQDESKD
jgi:hypothetical protein